MEKRKIHIEMIHDIVCSWCPIGYYNLKAALNRMKGQIDADIRFLPFELNPNMAANGETIESHLKRRNGWTAAQFLRYRNSLMETAAEADLVYDFSKRTHYYNTAKAHTLLHWAERFGKQEALNKALIKGYFTEGLNIDNCDTLVAVTAKVGPDLAAAREALGSGVISHELQLKKDRVRNLNIGSVPAFLVDGVDLITGSNSPDYFVQYFTDYLAQPAERIQFEIAGYL